MKPDLKIYVDGQLSYSATYLPVLKRGLLKLGNDFNGLFVR